MLDGKDLISRARLKDTICELMNSGESTIVSAAAYLGTSPRSLQRQLELLQITYSEIVDEVRHELARELLASTDLGIAKIGASLGYRDPSSFSRAFMRWSGTSPRDYRDAYREGDGGGA
jgi:AraC-like DNA-binding protein